MCRGRVKTGSHLLALVQKQCRLWRHDKLKSPRFALNSAGNVRGFERQVNWYGYKPNPVRLWYWKVQTVMGFEDPNRPLHEHNKPNIALLNKEEKSGIIINVACPFDARIVSKERQKVDNSSYCDLKYEITRFFNCRTFKVIAIVIGALGTVSKDV